jgi:hypothetical protein
MANPTLGAGRAKTATIAVTDKFGNPAAIDGLPVWESTDETIAAVNPSADGLSCTVVSTGQMGTVQINVRLDADLGDGVRELNGMALLDVNAGAASAIALMLSEDFDPDMTDTPDDDDEGPVPAP